LVKADQDTITWMVVDPSLQSFNWPMLLKTASLALLIFAAVMTTLSLHEASAQEWNGTHDVRIPLSLATVLKMSCKVSAKQYPAFSTSNLDSMAQRSDPRMGQ